MKRAIISSMLGAGLALGTPAVADGADDADEQIATPAERQPIARPAEQKPAVSPVERKATPRPPVHSPEWTNPTAGDPGRDSVADDLQKIVVLCAADHDSPEFRRAWSAYVRSHDLQGARLDQTIQRVVNEAYRYRRESGRSDGDRLVSPEWKNEASKSMHDTSKNTIRNVKS